MVSNRKLSTRPHVGLVSPRSGPPCCVAAMCPQAPAVGRHSAFGQYASIPPSVMIRVSGFHRARLGRRPAPAPAESMNCSVHVVSWPTTGGGPQHSISQFSTNTETISTAEGTGVESVKLCIPNPEHSESRGATDAGSGSPAITIVSIQASVKAETTACDLSEQWTPGRLLRRPYRIRQNLITHLSSQTLTVASYQRQQYVSTSRSSWSPRVEADGW